MKSPNSKELRIKMIFINPSAMKRNSNKYGRNNKSRISNYSMK